MTPAELEAVKRAVAALTTMEDLLLPDWCDYVDRDDIITALSLLRPIAEGKSRIVEIPKGYSYQLVKLDEPVSMMFTSSNLKENR